MRMIARPRRLRRTPAIRDLVRETDLSPAHLVMPLFVKEGRKLREPIAALPGCFHLSPDEAGREAKALLRAGVRAVLLFGLPAEKDDTGSHAAAGDGPVPLAAREIKQQSPETAVITDVCLCAYTSHGHCGVLVGGKVNNDLSLGPLAETALAHARAGADLVAPSAMMDGQVAAIRQALDENGFEEVGVLAYAAKFASAFYGPFREAAGSAPAQGDRRAYQLDPPNAREALREIALDLAEGADIVMVKPALCYLDVLRAARGRFDAPLAAYCVSGEYAMVKAAAEKGWLEERPAALEILTAVRRAGADLVITYWAGQAARWLAGD